MAIFERKLRCNHAGRKLSCGSMLRIAYQHSLHRSCLSTTLSVSTHTIRRVLESVAYVQQSWQRTQSEPIGRLLTCMEDKLDFVIATISYDETGQKVSFEGFAPSHSGAERQRVGNMRGEDVRLVQLPWTHLRVPLCHPTSAIGF